MEGLVLARRKGILEDLLRVFARLPWWVGLFAALLTYAGLHTVATSEVQGARDLADFGNSVGKRLFRTVAAIAQWVIPGTLLLGAAISAVAQRSRQRLHDRVGSDQSASTLGSISWRQFEAVVHQYFRQRGFRVSETPPGPDGGVDLRLKKGADLYLVQCKQWKAQKVGVEVVRELYGVMSAEGAVGGFVVTSGRYTSEATRFADGREVELIDGEQLGAEIRKQLGKVADSASVPSDPPACPVCSSMMVKRVASKGQFAGQSFWGCSKYPGCRGRRSMSNL